MCALVFALFIFTNCKKDSITKCDDVDDPKCFNYNPCHDKTAADADFGIYEGINGQQAFCEVDTVFIYSYVLLRIKTVNQKGLSVHWRIQSGNFVKQFTDTVCTFFPATLSPSLTPAQFYTVTCSVSKDNGSCNDYKAIDSLRKVFYLWPPQYSASFGPPFNYVPIFGTYAGYKYSNQNLLVYVTIHDSVRLLPNTPCLGSNPPYSCPNTIIRNLAYNHFSSENWTIAGHGISYGASCLFFDPSWSSFNTSNQLYGNPGCYGSNFLIAYSGRAWLDLKNKKKININYQYKDTITNQWLNDFFIGTKIN